MSLQDSTIVTTASGRIVVVFSTYNGARTLRRVLDGYADVIQPPNSWRLVVVNNASTDETAAILDEYSSRLPLTILSNPRPGKNVSLNLALKHIALDADLFVFTDDDAVPEASFLVEWSKAIDSHSDAELLAGEIRPLFETSPPDWLRRFKGVNPILFAENVRAEGFIPGHEVFGPNMAVRRSIFEAGTLFREDIGPNSSDPIYPMGSETEFCMRAERVNGAKAYFVSGPKVRHIVRPHQMTRDFVKGRAYRQGRGLAMRDHVGVAVGDLPKLRWRGEIRLLLLYVVGAIGSSLAFWEYHVGRGFRGWLRERTR